MGSGNLNPMEELKQLDRQVDQATQLSELKPIFYRLEEIAKEYAADFEIQLEVGSVRQKVINRGTLLKQEPGKASSGIATPGPAKPEAGVTKPDSGAAKPTVPPAFPPASTQAPSASTPDLSSTPDLPSAPALSALTQAPGAKAPLPRAPKVPPAQKPGAESTGSGSTLPLPPVSAKTPSEQPASAPTTPQKPLGAAPPPLPGGSPQLGSSPQPGSSPYSGPQSGPDKRPDPAGMAGAASGALVAGRSSGLPQGSGADGAPPQQPPPDAPQNWKRPLWIGAAVGLLIALLMIAVLVNRGGPAAAEPVAVQFTTLPVGAAIEVTRTGDVAEGANPQVANPPVTNVALPDATLPNVTDAPADAGCTANCSLDLVPGTYSVTASLDGYQSAVTLLTVSEDQPAVVNLMLTALLPSVRILADMETGQVFLDGEQAGELEGGQFLLESVGPGAHTVRVTGGNMQASFAFESAEASLPQLTGPIATRNLLGVLVANVADTARLTTSAGPLKLTVNGVEEADASPQGVALAGFAAGVSELIVGEGDNERMLSDNFSAAPTLTAFLKSDQNIGTLIVATGENDVQVFLNGREQTRRTSRGELRVQTIGDVTVRVFKQGFREPADQTVTVAKGDSRRVSFQMIPLPEFSTLTIRGGTPGALVSVDDRPVGSVSGDGSFTNASVAPGARSIDLTRGQFEPKHLEVNFPAGGTVTLSGGDAVLTAIPLPEPPAAPKAKPTPAPPPPQVTTALPKPPAGTIANFDNPSLWSEEGGIWRHRGEGHMTYGLSPNGTFTFAIHLLRGGNLFRAGRVRWFVNYVDANNYLLFELDDENFRTRAVVNGKELERNETRHGVNKDDKQWTVQIDLRPDSVTHRIYRDGAWAELDTWSEPNRNFTAGKFGILVRGNDETGLSNFRFQPR